MNDAAWQAEFDKYLGLQTSLNMCIKIFHSAILNLFFLGMVSSAMGKVDGVGVYCWL